MEVRTEALFRLRAGVNLCSLGVFVRVLALSTAHPKVWWLGEGGDALKRAG